jgi:hypothetical protein
MWCGSQHLDDARELFKHWGFKRCEVNFSFNKLLKKKKIFIRILYGLKQIKKYQNIASIQQDKI